MMETARSLTFPALAPLTPPIAVHLASYLVRTSPRDAGRPPGPTMDVALRAEQRMQEALTALVPRVEQARLEVYGEMNAVVRSGSLTPSWLLQALARDVAGNTIVYPQRLVDWRQAHVLRYNRRGEPDAQSVASLLVARRIDPRRRGWLPSQLDQHEWDLSWSCWQQATPGLVPVPSPLRLDDEGKMQVPTTQSLLWTPWKGGAWMNGWLEVPGGAIGWADPEQVSYDLLVQWAPHLASTPPEGGDVAELSTGVLNHLAAERLRPSQPSSR